MLTFLQKTSPQLMRMKPYLKSAGLISTGLVAALLGIWLLGTSLINVEGVTIKASLAPSLTGITEFRLPPFGVIEARTHQGPVKLSLTLDQIDGNTLKAQINNLSDSKQFLLRLQKGIEDYVFVFAVRQIAAALIMAWLIILVVWRTKFKTALLYALLCGGLIFIPVIYAVHTYDPRAFNEPEYKGVLSMAPAFIEFAGDSLTDLQSIKQSTDKVITNLRKLFLNADSLMAMASPEDQQKVVKALIVSDLHANPVGVEFIKSTADQFQVDFIINIGDLTDFGTAAEAKTIQELKDINLPQLFVSGNHDSPELLKIVNGFDHFQVLNGKTVTVAGIKVLGFPDPLANGAAVEYKNSKEEQQMLAYESDHIKAAVEKQGHPDILVVHNASLGKRLMLLSNLTVSGHNHVLNVAQQDGSVFIDPGTAGAAGLRGLYSEEGKSYSAVVAYLVPGSGLLAMDLVEYSPTSNQFSLQRKLVQTFKPFKATL
ncbi:MAG: metallophosphoesterase family protein [Ignavibacteriales bacterium]